MRRLSLAFSAVALAFAGSCGDSDSVAAGNGETTGSSTGDPMMVTTTTAPPTTSLDDTAGSADGDTGPECTLADVSPCADDDPCTVDDCFDGACRNDPAPNDTPCTDARGLGGLCQDGACFVSCDADEDCDDGNVCTIDACDLGIGECVIENLDGVEADASVQAPGDCLVVDCEDGEPVENPDSSDEPDDRNDCTVDDCSMGAPVFQELPAGTSCGVDGFCNDRAQCVDCLGPGDCTGLPPDDECQTRTCIDGVCGQDFAPQGTEVNAALQTDGNCQLIVCDGAGDMDSVDDDTDVPVDGLECTDDVCNSGLPFNPPASSGTDCSAGVCNATGQCVGCIVPSDCGGVNTFCQTITCITSICGVSNTIGGIPLPVGQQTAFDCQQLQCDGNGTTQSVPDPTDVPQDDGNSCTSESCSNGLPQHPPLPAGEGCDDGLFCTLVDVCDGSGACGGSGNPCSGPDGDSNCAESCNEGTNQCNAPDPSGSACDDGLFCTMNDSCNAAGVCLGGGNPCVGADGDSNCAESCNEGADNCTGNDPNGSPCSDGTFCNGADTCSAGVCSGHAGNPCPGADGDGNCSESCNEAADTCTAPDPAGSACNDGLYCNGSDTCGAGGACSAHSGNPCLPLNLSDSSCAGSCSEALDNCTANDPSGTGCNDGNFCNGADSCGGGGNAGICSNHAGDPCDGPADGDCDCTETCNPAGNCNGVDFNFAACGPFVFGNCQGGQCIDGPGGCPGG